MIEARGLTKRYGPRTAVDGLSFQLRPGVVTGFLGPNGSGKSTTMRMILGLDSPTAGTATIGGRRYRDLPNPARTVGALLDAKAVHGGRSARKHLLCLAQLSGIPARRVDEVLAMVGLREVAGQRSRGFSLGMGQRLGIAAALLGDPQVLLFDEPVNGLDPEGIRWIRDLMRGLAAEGRTVLVSSHLMSEMALTADHLLIIGRGRLLADVSLPEFVQRYSAGHVRLRVAQPEQTEQLARLLTGEGGRVEPAPDGALQVTGLPLERVSQVVYDSRVRLLELTEQHASLEDAYLRMTQGTVEYRAGGDAPGPAPQPPYAPPQAGWPGAGTPPAAAAAPGGGWTGVPGAPAPGAPVPPPRPQPAPPAGPQAGFGAAPGGWAPQPPLPPGSAPRPTVQGRPDPQDPPDRWRGSGAPGPVPAAGGDRESEA